LEATAGLLRLQVNQEKNPDDDTVHNQMMTQFITSLWDKVNLMQLKN
jgi:hypothetical protein